MAPCSESILAGCFEFLWRFYQLILKVIFEVIVKVMVKLIFRTYSRDEHAGYQHTGDDHAYDDRNTPATTTPLISPVTTTPLISPVTTTPLILPATNTPWMETTPLILSRLCCCVMSWEFSYIERSELSMWSRLSYGMEVLCTFLFKSIRSIYWTSPKVLLAVYIYNRIPFFFCPSGEATYWGNPIVRIPTLEDADPIKAFNIIHQ